MKDKIKTYTQLNGISGNEYLIQNKLKEIFLQNNNEIFYDNLGSIATTIKSNVDNPQKIGVFAHMDEVGLMIQRITKNGIIKVVNVGGIDISTLISQRVEYINEKAEKFIGIVMSSSPHIENTKIKSIDDININFGFKSDDEAKSFGFEIGNYINLKGSFELLQNNNIITKAADNRIGCAIVDELYTKYAKTNNHFELTLGATVQEEIGLKGATTLINTLNKEFDWILIVDVSPIDSMEHIELGKGPLLRIAEPRGIYDISGNEQINCISKQLKINTQDYFSKGRTDGAAMQISKAGYKINAICVPAYNLHTNSTLFNLEDVDDILKIIEELLNEIQ